MNLKKILALILALTMTTAAFTACGDNSDDIPLVSGDQSAEIPADDSPDSDADADTEAQPLLAIDGKEVNTDGLIMMTIDGIDVPFDEWRYMYKYIDSYAYSYGDDDYWADFPERFDEMMTIVENQLLESHWGVLLAEKYGVEMTDDDKAEVETHLQEQRDLFETEEEYKTALEQSSITEDLLRKMIEQQVICNRVYEELYNKEGAQLVPTDDEMKADIAENFVRVYHVLVSYDHFAEEGTTYDTASDEEKAELKKQAEDYANELLEEIKNGADIYELAQEADDPGMIDNPDGYFFTYDYMVKPFEEAAFSLNVGELSGLVETDYGFHIIQRLEQEQYTEDNWADVRASYVNGLFNKQVDDLLANATIEYWEDYDKIVPGSVH